MNPPSVDSECVDVIGGHFNPFNVNISAGDDYGAECSIYSPLRCESGDLSNKHGQLNIDPGTSDRESVTYTDSNLNIFGPANYSSECTHTQTQTHTQTHRHAQSHTQTHTHIHVHTHTRHPLITWLSQLQRNSN